MARNEALRSFQPALRYASRERPVSRGVLSGEVYNIVTNPGRSRDTMKHWRQQVLGSLVFLALILCLLLFRYLRVLWWMR